MTTPQVPFNPFTTTNASGLFSTVSDGLVQGVAMDDPSVRNYLAGGVLASTEVLPMWQGVGVYEQIATATAQFGTNPMQNTIGRATTISSQVATNLTGFSVANQAHAGVITPQSPVPLFSSGQTINFYRLGSRARIALAMAPVLVDLYGSVITTQVSWDFVGQQLVPYVAAYAANTITGAVWASTGGGQITFTVSSNPTTLYAATDVIGVTGIVSTGGTGVGLNGSFPVLSTTSTTVVVSAPASASPGTYASGGSIAAGGGALPVKILTVQPANSKIVMYSANPVSATWNNNGAAAVVEL